METLSLERIIYQTIRYFDIFHMPITATQIWWCLVTEQHSGVRWGGHRQYALGDIQRELRESLYLDENIGTTYGYYFLKGKEHIVRDRLTRHNLAQDKWKIARRCARFLAAVPFVRGLAGSGSLALDNTSESSDLDFLVVAHPKRIWTTRLGLLLVSQLLGRRRKYWDRQAPDKLCLNHYVSASRLHLPAALHNLYNAVQYRHLVPVYTSAAIKNFQEENIGWMRQHLMPAAEIALPHYNEIRLPRWISRIKKSVESLLLEPIGDGIEYLAEKLQRSVIARHQGSKAGRVALSHEELAFHPDTKVPSILAAFQQDPGQRQLL